jgi:pectinesterase
LNDVAARVIVVAKEKGNDDFTTIHDVNAVPTNNTNLVLILVKPDIYEEKVTIPAEKLFIILSGSSVNNTIITWDDNEKSSGGTYYCTIVHVYHRLSPCIKSWKLATC